MRKQLENDVIWISPCELDTNQNSANSHVNYDIIIIPRKYFHVVACDFTESSARYLLAEEINNKKAASTSSYTFL